MTDIYEFYEKLLNIKWLKNIIIDDDDIIEIPIKNNKLYKIKENQYYITHIYIGIKDNFICFDINRNSEIWFKQESIYMLDEFEYLRDRKIDDYDEAIGIIKRFFIIDK
jgi:hypothetical protein